jgi:uncharacterized damage-inducible protein DinB
MKHSLTAFYQKDLQKLREEIALYPSGDSLWRIQGEVKNSGGNLALHISGAMLHFVGAVLGNTGYQRERELEFSKKGLSKEEVLQQIDVALEAVTKTMDGLTGEELGEDYPLQIQGKTLTTQELLVYMLSHVSYHLGQVNYHRRLVSFM